MQMVTGGAHRNRKLSVVASHGAADLFSDARTHPFPAHNRNVRLPRVTTSGSGAIAKSPDGSRCAVVGNDSLRIVRISDPSQSHHSEYKSATGRGGYRIDSSRNYWEGNGLTSANTDVAWCSGVLSHKIITTARNGELCMWDLNKSGASKCERREKGHSRSIHALAVSRFVEYYCVTGSADGDLRIWDLRDMTKCLLKIRHPTSIRAAVFSPNESQPLQAVVGLENGSLYRWDLKMGQRGQLDRVPVAHTGIVTTLDWCNASNPIPGAASDTLGEAYNGGMGWLASGGLDRCVKIWDLTTPSSSAHIPHKPTYVLHPSFPVRRIQFRPGYACEIAVVSSAEFGTGSNPDLAQIPLLAGPLGFSMDSKLDYKGKGLTGDPVEIWDARRGWIAKWAINGSASEGGVIDIDFGDSNALWALHTSGTFSQIDVRNATRPVDAVPRVAASWRPVGSLVFVGDRPSRFEIPYDDISPAKRAMAEERKIRLKALGDLSYAPISQSMGIYHDEAVTEQLEVFEALARGYIYEGMDRISICQSNANVAFQAGNMTAAQTWLLLGLSLTDLVPEDTTSPPQSDSSMPGMSQSKSAPAVLLRPPSAHEDISRSFEPVSGGLPMHSPVASRGSAQSKDRSLSASRRITPTSSNSSSPLVLPGGLPPITPRRPSVAPRRESAGVSSLMRRSSMLRRHSTSASAAVAMTNGTTPSTPSITSASPSDRGISLRHVGEGALDDSDSDSAESGFEGDDNTGPEDGPGDVSSEEDPASPLVSPAVSAARGAPVNPSPLSQVASGKPRWPEDALDGEDSEYDDEGSPSPRSTDSERSSDSSSPTTRRMRPVLSPQRRRQGTHVKSRSRSSTVASLAAPPRHVLSPPSETLARQGSQASIQTVTAGEASFPNAPLESSITESANGRVDNLKNFAQGNGVGDPSQDDLGSSQAEKSPVPKDSTERRSEIVLAEERKLRQFGWDALRDAVERYADEGDIQMCAMLALVAPSELRISAIRAARFVEAYIDILTRLQYFACCAYIRKHAVSSQIRDTTLVQTTIYTSCGKCRRPLAVPAGERSQDELVKGGFAYCNDCKQNCVTCAICRLPVRSLLFQCAVCSHGGHQVCYRRYYSDKPMEELPTVGAMSSRGRSTTPFQHSRESSETGLEGEPPTKLPGDSLKPINTHLFGHACAAGCGHFCWAANQGLKDD